MSMTIYVANIPANASQQDVELLFSPYGTIESIKLITDAETGQPAGYGFVEMDDEAAGNAIKGLADSEFRGQTLQVNQARGRSTDR